MGGERASTTRQREAGKTCYACGRLINPEPPGKVCAQRAAHRLCQSCDAAAPRHRVLMNFMHRNGWHIAFLEADCCTSLRARFTFADPAKLVELARRGRASFISADLADLDHGISMGRAEASGSASLPTSTPG